MLTRPIKGLLRLFGLLPLAARLRYSVQQMAGRLRYSVQQIRYRGQAAGLPIPPLRLNFLVTGTQSVDWYVKSGWLAAQSIRFALERNGIRVEDLTSILDFGCGSGRVIRHWRPLTAAVHGTDYNSDLIRWCERNLPFATFQTNDVRPSLQYPDGSFDLIYALSVFTHLDEEHQDAWMRELRRTLKPTGYLIITTHGPCPFYLSRLTAEERAAFDRGALIVRPQGVHGGNAFMAFHAVEYVKTRLVKDLVMVDYLAGGAFGNPYQDLWLLKKPG